jgi:hypothetical protein
MTVPKAILRASREDPEHRKTQQQALGKSTLNINACHGFKIHPSTQSFVILLSKQKEADLLINQSLLPDSEA